MDVLAEGLWRGRLCRRRMLAAGGATTVRKIAPIDED
jgi:hypothetical protein